MTITKTTNCGNVRWRVSFRLGGKTRREFFKTEAEAKKRARELAQDKANAGDVWLTIPSAARVLVIEAYRRSLRGGYTLAQACDLWERETPDQTLTLSELVRRHRESRGATGLRPKTEAGIQHTQKALLEALGDVPAASVTPEQVEAAMNRPGWGPGSRKSFRARAAALFAWAVRRGLLARNPVERVEAPRVEAKPPGILTVPDCRRFLALARDEFPQVLPCVLVMLFAGIRPVEATRLRWEDVRLAAGRLVVEAAASKIRQRRLVTIEPVLAEWLSTIPQEARQGALAGPAHSWRMDRLRARYGPFPPDGLRHSFVSYHVAHFRDIPRTALEAGHSVDVLMRHYRELVTPEAAAEFWALRPA